MRAFGHGQLPPALSKNIEGRITLDEAQQLLNSYYKENPNRDPDDRTEEADKVSARIAKLLSEKAFSFTPNEYLSIHKNLFIGIYSHAGKIRDYNITKKEWVLDGATVLYGSASELRATLEYDFSEERKFSYKYLNMDEIIHHLAYFVSRLWLRNALVRANYNDLKNGVHETTEYLELFLRNLLLDESNELHNRAMHISELLDQTSKADIEGVKANIEDEKTDIENAKADIQKKLQSAGEDVLNKTVESILSVYKKCFRDEIFGRSEVETITGLKSTRASELLKLMRNTGIIRPVEGHGKGKYRFTI